MELKYGWLAALAKGEIYVFSLSRRKRLTNVSHNERKKSLTDVVAIAVYVKIERLFPIPQVRRPYKDFDIR